MVKNTGTNFIIKDTYSAVLIHDESNLKQLGFSLLLATMPDLPLEKSMCRSESNILHWTWKYRLVPNRKRSTSGCIMSPCLFNFYTEYIMRNARLDQRQAGIKIAGRNFNHLRCRWHHPYGRKWRGTKKPLDASERAEWKRWLKAHLSENEDHGFWSHHFVRNRWGNSGNSVRLYFWGSKITADGDCRHEIKRCLPLERKVMTNLDSIFESRNNFAY